MRHLSILGAVALASVGGLAIAPAVFAQATPEAPRFSTNRSTIGTLLADPEARAILFRIVPEFAAAEASGAGGGGNFEQAMGMTLVELKGAIGGYAPTLLSDERLAALDAEFAKLGAAPAAPPAPAGS